MELLLQNGAQVDAEDINGNRAVHIAAEKGFDQVGLHSFLIGWQYAHISKVVKCLVDANAELGKGDKTPLRLAARMGHERVARLLIDSGVSPTKLERDGSTPIYDAAAKGQETVLKVRLSSPFRRSILSTNLAVTGPC